MATWTTAGVLEWARIDFEKRGFERPRLEAEVLLAHVLGCPRIGLYTGFDRPLDEPELAAFRGAIERRRSGEPAAYIVGHKEFWSLDIEVDERVLVPRPETETLVAAALDRWDGKGRVLDLCTGSGCVAVAIASERSDLQVDAVDVSAGACDMARRNAERHGLGERIRVLEGDLFAPIPPGSRYAVITANPPYVRDADIPSLSREVLREPRAALAGGPDGMEVIRRILAACVEFLEPDGWLLSEVDPRQVPEILGALVPPGLGARTETIRDLEGRERVIALQRGSEADRQSR